MSQTSAYPPGTWEGDPAAPWNQKEKLDPDQLQACQEMASDLFDALQVLKDDDPSWFGHRQPLAKVLASCQEIIDSVSQVREEILNS